MDLEQDLQDDLELDSQSNSQHYSDEERAFINELDAEEDAHIEIEDKASEQRQQQSELLALKAALPFAAKTVGFIDGMAKMKDARLAFSDDEKEMLTNAAAPVIVKYGAEPPAWLAEYGAELTLLGCIGLVSFNKLETLKAINREELDRKRRAIAEHQKAEREAAQCYNPETTTIH